MPAAATDGASLAALEWRVPHAHLPARPSVPATAQASTDPGTSVRKSAIKILWESCIRAPGFPRATG